MKRLIHFIDGIIIGIANVIPGVSGGTMMVILNIYDDFLYAISWKNYKKRLPFLISLGLGVLAGVLIFSHIMTFLLERFELPVYYGFIGLVLGSAPMIYRRARHEKVKPRNFVVFAITLAFMLILFLLDRNGVGLMVPNTDSGLGAETYLWIFISAAISTVAMILPGISGSLVLLLLGVYTLIMEAIATFDFPVLLTFGAGVLVGGFFGIKFIKTLLRFHPQALYFGILGLIAGSLVLIYPGPPVGIEGIISIVIAIVFASLAYYFSK